MERLILRDKLAIERTRLANERTFLAYFRTGIFFGATGISILKIELFSEVPYLGWALIGMAPFIILIGLLRLRHTRKRIESFYVKGVDKLSAKTEE